MSPLTTLPQIPNYIPESEEEPRNRKIVQVVPKHLGEEPVLRPPSTEQTEDRQTIGLPSQTPESMAPDGTLMENSHPLREVAAEAKSRGHNVFDFYKGEWSPVANLARQKWFDNATLIVISTADWRVACNRPCHPIRVRLNVKPGHSRLGGDLGVSPGPWDAKGRLYCKVFRV